MRKPKLTITKKLLIFITVPLVIELSFFAVLLQQFHDLEHDLEEEGRAVDALVQVNLILTGSMTGAGNMFMARAARNSAYLAQTTEEFSRVNEHVTELKRLAERDDNPSIKAFVKVIEETNDIFDKTAETAVTDEYRMESFKMSGSIKSFLRRLRIAGSRVIEEQNARRAKVREEARQKRAGIDLALEIMAVANIALAILAGTIFSMTMGRRLRTITDNTVRVSAGQPLNAEIKGSDELAKLDHLVHSMNDELAKTRKRERAIIDNTAEIICSLDRSFRVEEVNDAVQRRLGFDPSAFRGSLFQSHVEESERQTAYEQLKKTLGLEDEVSFEVRMVGGDGKTRDMEVTAHWSEVDQGIFCIMRDITLRKEAERMKQEVIAMISHDLRAPLTSIGMTLEMFCDGVLGELNQRGGRLASVARSSVGNLIMLINDLLDLERLEAAGLQLNYESVPIESIVREAVDTVSAEASSKQLSIETSYDDGNVSVDSDRIRRVLINLLNNAIKFSPSSTMILIKAVIKDDWLRVDVIDEGPGIPEEQLAYVFDKFRQVGTGSSGEKKGSGLGLAICKSFVEAHNGKMGVTSRVGEGTTFWFDIPVEAKVAVLQDLS